MDPRDRANQLIDDYGNDAAAKALMQVLEKRILGDLDGEHLWLAVLSAVLELQNKKSDPSMTVH